MARLFTRMFSRSQNSQKGAEPEGGAAAPARVEEAPPAPERAEPAGRAEAAPPVAEVAPAEPAGRAEAASPVAEVAPAEPAGRAEAASPVAEVAPAEPAGRAEPEGGAAAPARVEEAPPVPERAEAAPVAEVAPAEPAGRAEPAAPRLLETLRWGPTRGRKVETIVFLCHGMGSSAKGIIQIAPQLGAVLPSSLFVAPNGPEAPEVPGEGRLWFDARNRSPAALEAGVRGAAAALDAVIDAELEKAGLARDAYALAGYSQGAMTALFAGLRRTPPPRAILCYAGALIAPHRLAEEMAGRAPVMLVHGLEDPVVPAFYSRDAEKALRALRVPVQGIYVPRLGHGIDATATQAGKQFLARWLAPAAAESLRVRSAAHG